MMWTLHCSFTRALVWHLRMLFRVCTIRLMVSSHSRKVFQKTSALNESQKTSLTAFLEQCDLLKFARFEPPESMLRELHDSALRLVHETQFDPATAPQEGAGSPTPPATA